MLYLAGCYWLHKVHLLSMPSMQAKIFKKLFLDRSALSIKSFVEPFLDRYFTKMLYLPAVSKLEAAQKEGQYTLILSSSPDFLVQAIAKRFKVNEWQATVYEIDENEHFNTLSRFMEGKDKSEYLENLQNLMGIPKENITAYSDSILDVSFLQSAGIPIAVNPDHSLHTICRKNNWQIL